LTDHKLSVLLIEGGSVDALTFREALRRQTEQSRVDIVRSSADALARLESLAHGGAESPFYDAVAVNMSACERPALSLLAELGQIMPDTPVVAVIPREAEGVRADALRAGAAEVVYATPEFSVNLASVVRLAVEKRRLHVEIDKQREQLLELASRDELTGLANRRRFNEAIDLEVERAHRYHRPVTLLLLDLDALKLVNDTHGHPAGDAALRHIGACLRSEIRRFEVAARLGGDEFAVLLVDTNFDQGRLVAEKLRRSIAETPVPPAGQVTISCGIAALPAHAESATDLVRVADQALYEAKRGGRNRVVVSKAIVQERDGDRHPVRFRIAVAGRNSRGENFTEETETELISRRGARIVSSNTVAAGEQIELRTPFHSRALVAQITSCYRGVDNRWRLGFKLVDPPRWGG
jgi:diguanylate cyclase (GGDEF)-like protein